MNSVKPILKNLPLLLSELLGLAELQLCQVAITPSCIAGMSTWAL